MSTFSFSLRLLILGLVVFSGQAQAHILITPAKAVYNPSQKTLASVAYLHPCGAKALGIIYDRKEPKLIALGVALSLPSTTCTGLPSVKSLDASAMRFAKDTKFASFKNELKKTPLQFSRVHNLKFNQKTSTLQIVHHRSCNALLNSMPVLNQTKDGISVGVLEYRRQKEGACRHSQLVINLPAKMASRMTYLNTLQNQDQDRELMTSLPYQLKLAPIKAIRTAPSKGLEVSFERSCKDAPVGIFIRKISRENATKYMVAALTAHFPQKVCESSRAIRSHIQIPQFRLPASKIVAVRSRQIAKVSDLQVMKPQQIKMLRNTMTTTAQAQVQFIKDCDRHLGLVFAQDQYENLSVGVLKKQERFRCDGDIRSQTMQQPMIITKSLPNSRIYPLNLEGQAAI